MARVCKPEGRILLLEHGRSDREWLGRWQDRRDDRHGVGGRGDGPSAKGLEPKPADFTNCKVMAKDSDEVLLKIIKGGGQSVGRSTVMPAWGDSLSEQQIGDLVKFIRGLCKK